MIYELNPPGAHLYDRFLSVKLLRRLLSIRLPNVEEIQGPHVGNEVSKAIEFVDDVLHFFKPKYGRLVIRVVGGGPLLFEVPIQVCVVPTLRRDELNVPYKTK